LRNLAEELLARNNMRDCLKELIQGLLMPENTLTIESLLAIKKQLENLDDLADYKYEKQSSKTFQILERIMNKFGWYRKTTIYIIDKQKMGMKFYDRKYA